MVAIMDNATMSEGIHFEHKTNNAHNESLSMREGNRGPEANQYHDQSATCTNYLTTVSRNIVSNNGDNKQTRIQA